MALDGRPKPEPSTNYTVRMVGWTRWKGREVVAVDVTFPSPVECGASLGGQGAGDYAPLPSEGQSARIFIEPGKAIPMLEEDFDGTPPSGQAPVVRHATWEFNPRFFQVNDGLAPRAFDFNPDFDKNSGLPHVGERQEFQVVNGAWMFLRGRSAVWANGFAPFPKTGGVVKNFIQSIKGCWFSRERFELTQLQFNSGGQAASPDAH